MPRRSLRQLRPPRWLDRRPRILHAPWNVGGNPVGLSRGEREIGLVSDVLVFEQHKYGYPADIDLEISGTEFGLPEYVERRAKAAKRALHSYDVFHFNFGQTIVQSLDEDLRLHTELPQLKEAGKKILATFQGDDVRPPEANPVAGYDEQALAEVELLQEQRRDALLEHADRVFYLNPDLHRYLPGAEFRPYASLDPWTVEPVAPPDGEEVVIAHAPSDPGAKGTSHVVAATDALRAEGVPVRLDLIEGATRAEAMGRFAAADIGIDQLHQVGWYGGVSVEFMAIGRPVLCRILDENDPVAPSFTNELPIVRTDAPTLKEDIRALVVDRDRRRELGERGRRFVERHHDPRRIAAANLEGIVEIPRPPPAR